MANINTNTRERCLYPGTGQHCCVIKDGSNTYYYVVYRDYAKRIYLAYSNDIGITWDNAKLLIKDVTSSITTCSSIALDHANKKIYVVYVDSAISGTTIKVVTVDCTIPTSPTLGTEYNISAYATDYDMPVCALGVDGGLHVGAHRFDFGGFATNYYSIKSGIAAGQPDLTSWSSVYNIGNTGHASYYGCMRIIAHPDNNRLVALFPVWTASTVVYLNRSLNTTGTWNGWMSPAIYFSGSFSYIPALTTYLQAIEHNLYSMSVISGWNYAYVGILLLGTTGANGHVYDFMGDIGVGIVTPVVSFSLNTNPVTAINDITVSGNAYPGDYHGHFFFNNTAASSTTYNRSYSFSESYITGAQVVLPNTPGNISGFDSPVWIPSGLFGDKVLLVANAK